MSEANEADVREEVSAWLNENWDPNLGLVEWREKLIESGWGAPTWPVEWYGKGYSDALGRAIDEEFEKIGAITVARTGIRSLGIFNGKVIVKKGAQQTDAKQSTKNLILNDSAVAHSNPQLEIYADEVKCSHGSTTGQLDQDAIFYMRSRGIDYKTAQLILINGFAKEVLKIISEKNVNQYINKQLSFWLENAGIT